MTQEVTTARSALPATGDPAQWSDQERALVIAAGLVHRVSYGPKEGQVIPAPRAVVEQFLHTARRTRLDPLARQLYCIGRMSNGEVQWSIQTSIDGFRVIAERSGQYAGQGPAEWLTTGGDWVDVFIAELHGQHPLAARATIYRHDFSQPLTAVATWDAYVQTKRNGEPTSMWERMGPLMLAKCAEALALRKAFPQDLSGLYTADEMSQAESSAPAVEPIAAQVPEAQDVGVRDESPSEAAQVVEHVEHVEHAEEVQGELIESSSTPGERDWLAEVKALTTPQAANALWVEARDQGLLDATITTPDGDKATLRQLLLAMGGRLREQAAAPAEEEADAEPTEG